jgi:hypothetical protein
VTTARVQWGTPSQVEDDALTFDRGRWVIHVTFEDGVIVTIGLISAN